ncbi:MAG: chemotaxis protein CheR [Zetaproteobacteria bacterium CG12_big_fil_rev_8_21_14_0_65_55_1124]|nr:MAG: chemotaxis protein CheR [Zetaproteobacteria bacterium CG1_02_55_237]PIS18713.1 MAG: chemotaxis protein CheR [Zetaproteobacteria bacterium CG08_land_8_20_14_0_20_55_17]PIW43944.1 MAG: chemotaxis protein CheR [Zetaproteobacteria bacterium CG12_big_fil_rev_8_21_14_0_65_55_1124]PIY52440.1 MAG: chemotaxis protein CheR [Zetaproteobacteria bacterium CG_4_10_14_0_8_um_filter_55_43]PIZ36719.1 MAG: chemotaxis protein CheR [Zetaproteobacteria bacterium CG_4_10_14_0_2_um_filter_55_20]PJB81033.1 MA
MAISAESFAYLSKMIYENSAIVVGAGKEYLVESRLRPLVAQNKFSSIEDYVRQLKATPFSTLHKEVIEAMTTNETSFFRDIHPFEAIKEHVLPEMIKSRASTRQLNIWSGACSSGQEPYSLAIMIREHFPMLSNWKINIIATDLSEDVLNIARKGCYRPLDINRGLPAALMVKYFEKQGVEWQVKREIRGMVDFRQMNLSGHWPSLPSMDIVLMRNVLIYFDQETKRGILGKIRRVLKPDGPLFLGSAETTFNLDDSFKRVVMGKAAAYRAST